MRNLRENENEVRENENERGRERERCLKIFTEGELGIVDEFNNSVKKKKRTGTASESLSTVNCRHVELYYIFRASFGGLNSELEVQADSLSGFSPSGQTW